MTTRPSRHDAVPRTPPWPYATAQYNNAKHRSVGPYDPFRRICRRYCPASRPHAGKHGQHDHRHRHPSSRPCDHHRRSRGVAPVGRQCPFPCPSRYCRTLSRGSGADGRFSACAHASYASGSACSRWSRTQGRGPIHCQRLAESLHKKRTSCARCPWGLPLSVTGAGAAWIPSSLRPA